MDVFNLVAKIGINTSEYDKGISKAENKTGKFTSNVKKNLSSAANVFVKAGSSTDTLTNRIKVMSAQYESAQKKVDELSKKFNESAKKTGVTSKETQELAKELDEAEKEASEAKKKLDSYTNSVDNVGESSEKAESKVAKFANGAKTALKAATAAFTAVGGAVVALSKKSIEAYANYEQLVGGVETLFGAQGMSIEEYAKSVGKSVNQVKSDYDQLMKAQDLVMENANKAWKSAGLSANDYMETITGFAASLKQSTKDETEAAEIANRAVIDMSDNANKMGTSMESIQNAYQGFAKQNYTMLDNLNTMGALVA